MDELDRALSDLRQSVVESGTRIAIERRAPESADPGEVAGYPPRPSVPGAAESRQGASLSGADAADVERRVPGEVQSIPGVDVGRGRGTRWERVRVGVLAMLTAVLALLLLF